MGERKEREERRGERRYRVEKGRESYFNFLIWEVCCNGSFTEVPEIT